MHSTHAAVWKWHCCACWPSPHKRWARPWLPNPPPVLLQTRPPGKKKQLAEPLAPVAAIKAAVETASSPSSPPPVAEAPKPAKPAVAEKLKAALDEPVKETPKVMAPAAQAQRVAPRTVATASEPPPSTPSALNPQEPPAIPASIFIGKPVPLAEFSTENWAVIFPQLTLTGVTRSIASHCAFVSVQGKACSLLLDTRHAALFNEEHRKRIEQALADYFGTALQVAIETGTPSSETPAARRLRLEDERK